MRSHARVAQLHALIDILDEAIAEIPAAEIGDQLCEIKRATDRLEAVFAHGLRRVDRSRAYRSDGALTLTAWLRWRCRFSPAAAAQRVGLARRLEELPETNAALTHGEVSVQHAALISRTAGEIGVAEVRRGEPTLVEAARKLDARQFSAVTRHLRHCVDPDGFLADANRDHERRFVTLSQSFDGLYFLEGVLDAEGGATLQTAINAVSSLAVSETRTGGQRRADALVELARRHLDGGALPRVAGQLPHLTVTASVEQLAALRGQPAAHLEWSLPVPAETARRLACDAGLTTVFVDDAGAPTEVGRARRTVPPNLRRALVARDRGCRFPGCDRPADWTDAHHIKHWANGGATTLSNLILLCRRHHRSVHEEEWRLNWGEDGHLVAIPPLRLRHLAPSLSAHGPPAA